MSDLERFFDLLVRNLTAGDPTRLSQALPIMEVRNSVLPFRTHRRALGLGSTDEYEELLVRLVGEEGGLVSTQPQEVADWCRQQMASLSPDLSGIPGQATATIAIRPEALERVLGQVSAEAMPRNASAPGGKPAPAEACIHCAVKLPANRAVNFCPSCGRNVTIIPCDACGADMEPGWRFCVNCGQESSESAAPGGQA